MDRQQPGGQDGQPRLSGAFHHTGQQQIPHRDLEEDVAGTCGRRSTGTDMERHRKIMEAKSQAAQLVSVLALCAKK